MKKSNLQKMLDEGYSYIKKDCWRNHLEVYVKYEEKEWKKENGVGRKIGQIVYNPENDKIITQTDYTGECKFI